MAVASCGGASERLRGSAVVWRSECEVGWRWRRAAERVREWVVVASCGSGVGVVWRRGRRGRSRPLLHTALLAGAPGSEAALPPPCRRPIRPPPAVPTAAVLAAAALVVPLSSPCRVPPVIGEWKDDGCAKQMNVPVHYSWLTSSPVQKYSHLFFTAFSARPGSSFAISHQWLPNRA